MTDRLPDFGDYVLIEQKRYGVPNEFWRYKVIGNLRSNTYRLAPADARSPNVVMQELEDVVNVVCCGVAEDTIERFRVSDVKLIADR